MTAPDKLKDEPIEFPDVIPDEVVLKSATENVLEVYLQLLVDTVDFEGDEEGQTYMFSPAEAMSLSDASYYVFDPDEHVMRKYPLLVSTDIEETLVQSFCAALYGMGRQVIQTAKLKRIDHVRVTCVHAGRVLSEGLRWHGLCNHDAKPYTLLSSDLLAVVFKHTPLNSEELQMFTPDFFEDAFNMTDLQFWLKNIVKVDPTQIPAI